MWGQSPALEHPREQTPQTHANPAAQPGVQSPRKFVFPSVLQSSGVEIQPGRELIA
jgi:hypothetical protein